MWSGAGFLIKPQVLNGRSAENGCPSLCGDYAIIIQQLRQNCALYVMPMMEFNQFDRAQFQLEEQGNQKSA